MRDLKDAKPGEVYRDRDGDVWGVMDDGRIVPVFRSCGHMNVSAPGFAPDERVLADYGPFVLLTPDEDA